MLKNEPFMSNRRFKKGTFSRKIRFYFLTSSNTPGFDQARGCQVFDSYGHTTNRFGRPLLDAWVRSVSHILEFKNP